MRRISTVFWCVVATVLGVAASAQEDAGTDNSSGSPIVLELFTSQGCSSCPPADDLMRQLAGRDDVIGLALHVDYWDYIGWKDVFASPQYTKRQKQYARAAGERAVYTPQMIIGGVDHVIGAKPVEVMEHLSAHAALDTGVSLSLRRDGDTLLIVARTLRPLAVPATVQMVRYTPEARVSISRGENAGRTVSYTNIVTAWNVLGEWSGAGPLDIDTSITGDAPVVVILQEAGPGLILAAARLR